MLHCLQCKSDNIKKNGYGRYKSQRYLCKTCNSSFTPGGKRGTYSPEFKQHIIELYCHQHHKSSSIIQNYGISTRTLVKWKQTHIKTCNTCQ